MRIRSSLALAALALALAVTSLAWAAPWLSVSSYPKCMRTKDNVNDGVAHPAAGDTSLMQTDVLDVQDAVLAGFRVYSNNASVLIDSVTIVQVSNNDSTWDTITSGGQYFFTDSITGKDWKSSGGKSFWIRPTVSNSASNWGVFHHKYLRLLFIVGTNTAIPVDSCFADGKVYR